MSGSSLFFLEMKAKSRMLYHPYTGIDLADWHLYKSFQHPTYILFADPSTKSIYGQWTTKLEEQPSKNFGKKNKEVITWPLSGMTFYRELTDLETSILLEYENSNYKK